MTSEPQILDLEPAPAPEFPSESKTSRLGETAVDQSPLARGHRGNGKIARFSKEIRDQINNMG